MKSVRGCPFQMLAFLGGGVKNWSNLLMESSKKLPTEGIGKEIQIILRLFLVITMYCQASSSQFQSINQPLPQYVASKSPETTCILFELP